MSRRTVGFTLGTSVLLALTATYLMTPSRTPAGQPALVEIDTDTLAALQTEFNRAPNSLRVVLLMSPTCPTCLQGAAAVEKILKDHAQHPLTVIAVWEPMLPTDWSAPGRLALQRLGDSRVRQFWDPNHLVAALFKSAGAKWKARPDCCERNGFLWDMTAVFAPGTEWHDTLPEPIVLNGTIVDTASELEASIAKNNIVSLQ